MSAIAIPHALQRQGLPQSKIMSELHELICLLMLQAYLADGDATAAEKALRELAVPFFHHEFVRQAVMQALHSADSESRILSLLGKLSECGLVSSNQLAKVRASLTFNPGLGGNLRIVSNTPDNMNRRILGQRSEYMRALSFRHGLVR